MIEKKTKKVFFLYIFYLFFEIDFFSQIPPIKLSLDNEVIFIMSEGFFEDNITYT